VENKRQKEKALILCERANAGAYQKCGGPASGCGAKKQQGTLEGIFESLPPVGADMPQALPPADDIKKPEIKLEESKVDDRPLPPMMEPVTPASAAVPEKPVQMLPSSLPPPPSQGTPKVDDSKTLPIPPLPPPPMSVSGASKD
jgi:hypothetical protein